MLFLLFDLGADRYAVDVREVKEVLPLLELRALPQAPQGVVGLCDFHGHPVPVIDLCLLVTGAPARRLLSTRIILVHYRAEAGGENILGLIAEKATETLRRAPGDFVTAGIRQDETPYLGPVTPFRQTFVQWVDVQQLLPEAVRDRLFKLVAEC